MAAKPVRKVRRLRAASIVGYSESAQKMPFASRGSTYYTFFVVGFKLRSGTLGHESLHCAHDRCARFGAALDCGLYWDKLRRQSEMVENAFVEIRRAHCVGGKPGKQNNHVNFEWLEWGNKVNNVFVCVMMIVAKLG